MSFHVFSDYFLEKKRYWDSLTYDDQGKVYSGFVEWNLKYFGWCALTGTIARYAHISGSGAALGISIYMTFLLGIHLAIPCGKLMVGIASHGRSRSGWKEKFIWFLLFLAISLIMTFFVSGVMGEVVNLIIAISRT
ncbi:hypothetical protein [Azospirillum doebereinerae]